MSVDVRLCREQRAGQVTQSANSGRSIVETVRPRLCQGDEIIDGPDRELGVDDQYIRLCRQLRNGRKVFDEIVGKVLVQIGIDRMARRNHGERVSVRRCIGSDIDRDGSIGARPVINDDRLTQGFSQLLRNRSCGEIDTAASGEGNDQANRFGWVVLRGVPLSECLSVHGESRDRYRAGGHPVRSEFHRSTDDPARQRVRYGARCTGRAPVPVANRSRHPVEMAWQGSGAEALFQRARA